jgi:starch phosphorylase
VALLGSLLPRHLEIITEIDRRFRDEVARHWPDDDDRIGRMAIVSDGPGDPGALRPLVDDLLGHDEFLVLADYRSYIDAQDDVDAAWADRDGWARRSILNTARGGFFSSDRAIADYLRQIWRAAPYVSHP